MMQRFLPTELDLEVESLFLEILHDPRARLFRAERAPEARRWILPDAPVGPHAPSLTKAERKLLTSYREEVAYLLRHAYLDSLLSTTRFRYRISRYVGSGTPVAVLPRAKILSRLRALPGPGVRVVARDLKNEVFEAFPGDPELGPFRDARLTLSQLLKQPSAVLQASARLVSHESLPIYFGLEALRGNRTRLAQQLYTQARDATGSIPSFTAGGSGLGMIAFHRGDYVAAQVEYRRVAEIVEDSAVAAVGWFVSSVQLGDREAAEAAARSIASIWHSESPELREMAHLIRQQRLAREWGPTAECLALLSRLRDDFPGPIHSLLGAVISVPATN